jgi:hypothetical protein
MPCHACKYWCRGTKVIVAPDAKYWNGVPHDQAGTTQLQRIRFECHGDDQDVGECRASEREGKTMIVGTCDGEGIYGEVITDADFGCMLFEAGSFEGNDDHYHIMNFP